MDRTKGEWSENFYIEVATSILPPLESRSWEMKNLSMRDTAEHAPDLPLSKVNSFADIFRKLSSFHVPLGRIGVLGGAMQPLPFCAFGAFRPPLRAWFLPSG
jgi:hypothetical protein